AFARVPRGSFPDKSGCANKTSGNFPAGDKRRSPVQCFFALVWGAPDPFRANCDSREIRSVFPVAMDLAENSDRTVRICKLLNGPGHPIMNAQKLFSARRNCRVCEIFRTAS